MKRLFGRSLSDPKVSAETSSASRSLKHKYLIRLLAVVGAALLASTLIPAGASADHVPSVVVLDSGGIDQVDGGGSSSSQSDLTGVIVGPHGDFGFAWDEVSLTGANTSDTCTYYLEPDDTVTAVCFSVKYTAGVVADGFPIWEVFDCGLNYDPANQKCAPSATTSTEFGATCTGPTLVDPYFEADTDQDLQATCQLTSLDGSDVDSLLLLNSCSKSSASPSSASKDCIFSGPVVFLALDKVVDGGTADSTDWTLAASGANDVSGAGSVLATPVTPGTYTLAEAGSTAATADYELESLVCSTDGGEPVDITETAEIELAGNFTVTTCTFTNTLKKGEIIVNKSADPADTDTTFTFNPSWEQAPVALSAGTTMSFGSDVLAAGDYTALETVPDGWAQTSAVCTSTDDTDASTLAALDLGPGETITCNVVNTKLADPVVAKTGTRDGTTTWTWNLDKTLDLDESAIDTVTGEGNDDLVAFPIDQGKSQSGIYTVSVNASSTTAYQPVDWAITIANPRTGPMAVRVTDDEIAGLVCTVSDEGEPIVVEADIDTGLYTIPADTTMTCTGTTASDNTDNAVVVTVVDGQTETYTTDPAVTANAADNITIVDACVTLSDTNYPNLADDEICGEGLNGPVSYVESFDFNAPACGLHEVNNTATVNSTDEGGAMLASDTVEVDYTTECALMEVDKSGALTGTETWTWSVDKNINLENAEEDDVANLIIPQNDTVDGLYEIIVSGSSETTYSDVTWMVTVTNPRSTAETITIDDDAVTLDCVDGSTDPATPVEPVDGEYGIAAGQTLTCTGTSVSDVRSNEVTVSVVGETEGETAEADAELTIDTVDGCVSLTDNRYPDLNDAEICGDELDENGQFVTGTDPALPVEFGALECGDYSVDNTATIFGDNDAELDSDTVIVNYEVTCGAIEVEKSGRIVGTTTWNWEVDKNIDLDGADGDTNDADDEVGLTLDQDETATGDYEIVVSGSSIDSGDVVWVVDIENPRFTPVVVSISDLAVELSCTVDGEDVRPDGDGNYTIPAEGAINCEGTSGLDETTNTVLVDVIGEGGDVDFEVDATADGSLQVKTRCVDLTDSEYGELDQQICADDADGDGLFSTTVIKADVAFGSIVCGPGSVVNIATLTGDADPIDSDTVTVDYTVECDDLSVVKSGSLSGATSWTWDVDKNIDLDEDGDGTASLILDQGEIVSGEYTIDVTGFSDTSGEVAWTVDVANPRLTEVMVSVIDDDVALTCAIGGEAAVPVDGLYTIPAESTLACTGLTNYDETENSVTVDIVDNGVVVDTLSDTASAEGSLDVVDGCVDFADSVYDDLDREICADDLDGDGLLQIVKSGVEFGGIECGPGQVVNVASLDDKTGEELDSDAVTVDYTIDCANVTATKVGQISGDVVWTWEIDKNVNLDGDAIDGNPDDDVVDFPMSHGSSMPVDYTVDLSASSEVVDGLTSWIVEVNNPRLSEALVTVTDDDVELDCTVDGEAVIPDGEGVYAIPAESTLVCEGTSAVDVTTNDATVELEDGTVIELSAEAEGGLTDVDQCVTVADTLYPELNQTICVDELTEGSIGLGVSGVVVADGECGATATTVNTASATGDDSGSVVDDTVTINNTIECEFQGCTYTRGYWRNHSELGRAKKTDPTWELVGGAEAEFLDSGLTYYEILSSSARGDKWLILASQYIAAELNVLSGSDPAVVSDEMAAALDLLSNNDPGTLTKHEARFARNLASHLDAYNNGYIGPGHCG